MDDDFATPQAMAQIFTCVRAFNQAFPLGTKKNAQNMQRARDFLKFIKEVGLAMALFQEEPHSYLKSLDNLLLKVKGLSCEDVQRIIEERVSARANKDYQKSDELRDKLDAMGIEIRDGAQGTTWEVKKS